MQWLIMDNLPGACDALDKNQNLLELLQEDKRFMELLNRK